ncbi:MAG TPA: nickel-binding protein [Acidimicrobiia bacterium]|nr:nickel-binding protein [Acidimicrobiia bacterium]
MFLDRHETQGLTPEDISEAHKRDVDIQEAYGVRYHTYWFDPDAGTVFCLAEGPTKEAVEAVHRDAHGGLATTILELDQDVPLNAMFGSMPMHRVGTPYTASAVRVIVFTDMVGSVQQTRELGDDGHLELLHAHNDIVRAALAAHGGREVKHTGDGIMAAFSSVASAVAFSVSVQSAIDERNRHARVPLEVSIGVSAGEPVTDEHDDLFGAAVQLAARLCSSAPAGDIFTSLAVRELCIGKQFVFEDRGAVPLKGLSEATPVFAVCWRDLTSETRGL